MRVTLEPTDQMVHLELHGLTVRVWSGYTDTGLPVHFMVARIAVPEGLPEEAYIDVERVLVDVDPRDPVCAALVEALS